MPTYRFGLGIPFAHKKWKKPPEKRCLLVNEKQNFVLFVIQFVTYLCHAYTYVRIICYTLVLFLGLSFFLLVTHYLALSKCDQYLHCEREEAGRKSSQTWRFPPRCTSSLCASSEIPIFKWTTKESTSVFILVCTRVSNVRRFFVYA